MCSFWLTQHEMLNLSILCTRIPITQALVSHFCFRGECSSWCHCGFVQSSGHIPLMKRSQLMSSWMHSAFSTNCCILVEGSVTPCCFEVPGKLSKLLTCFSHALMIMIGAVEAFCSISIIKIFQTFSLYFFCFFVWTCEDVVLYFFMIVTSWACCCVFSLLFCKFAVSRQPAMH